MELPSLVTAVMQRIEGPKYVLLSPLAIIFQLSQYFICNIFIAGSNATSKITSSLLWIFSVLPCHASISTQIITNFIVLSILQENCNTYIVTGVAGSSNIGSQQGNGSSNGAEQTGNSKFFLRVSNLHYFILFL